jgi:hypothetical protein
MSGVLDAEDAKVEAEVCERLRKLYTTADTSRTTGGRQTWLAPFAADHMISDETCEVSDEFRQNIKSLTVAGVENADRDEMVWIAKKAYGQKAKPVLDRPDPRRCLGGSPGVRRVDPTVEEQGRPRQRRCPDRSSAPAR